MLILRKNVLRDLKVKVLCTKSANASRLTSLLSRGGGGVGIYSLLTRPRKIISSPFLDEFIDRWHGRGFKWEGEEDWQELAHCPEKTCPDLPFCQ